jgi:hypothetical protein
VVWGIGLYALSAGPEIISVVVSMSGGALLANIISVILLVIETFALRK